MTTIKSVAVAGAGTMGSGIAIVTARAGFPTVLYDLQASNVERARRQTEGFFAKSVSKGKLAQAQVDDILGNWQGTTEIDQLADCDIVIEAVFENLEVKHRLLEELNAVCGEQALFASNTSTLSITEIAAGSGRDDRVVGMHFCLPAPLMKLVEMSPGLNTDESVFKTACEFCQALGQKPVTTKDSPGFILNDFLVPMLNDVLRLIDAGVAEPAEIDKAMKHGLGYAMGPCELLDLIGFDTQVLLGDAFHASTHDPRAACPPLVKRMVAAGRLGRKSGRGLYNYGDDAMFGG